MADDGPTGASTTQSSPPLAKLLAEALPQDVSFTLYHVSTAPILTTALYSAPPQQNPPKTFRESHFLAISIQTDEHASREVLAFAVEVLVFTTISSTTIFVSKADSSGYLQLLKLPPHSSSPIREVTSTFLTYIAEQRKRDGIQTVVSLFARAQSQYLFPGSVHNKTKHILNDRDLIKWWCRVLNPLVENKTISVNAWQSKNGYLIVPGVDRYETRSFLPRASADESWQIGHPLHQISQYSGDVPPRCLVPHFPDDPKARFLDTLDEELTDDHGRNGGQWKSIRTLEMFWEMMAFRQECSAGRLVGFIWIVLDPVGPLHKTNTPVLSDVETPRHISDSGLATPQSSLEYPDDSSFPLHRTDGARKSGLPSGSKKPRKKHLTGPITVRQPRIKERMNVRSSDRSAGTAYYIWPESSRGQVVLDEKEYSRMDELLLCLNFENLDLACEATSRWTSEVRSVAGGGGATWGSIVVGSRPASVENHSKVPRVTTLDIGAMRKKRKDVSTSAPSPESTGLVSSSHINVLGTGMVRKKAKT